MRTNHGVEERKECGQKRRKPWRFGGESATSPTGAAGIVISSQINSSPPELSRPLRHDIWARRNSQSMVSMENDALPLAQKVAHRCDCESTFPLNEPNMYNPGFDLQGNTFWEFKDALHALRNRRIAKYSRSTHLSEVKISRSSFLFF